MAGEDELLTRAEAAERLHLSTQTVRRLAEAGHLAEVQVGLRAVRVRSVDRLVREGLPRRRWVGNISTSPRRHASLPRSPDHAWAGRDGAGAAVTAHGRIRRLHWLYQGLLVENGPGIRGTLSAQAQRTRRRARRAQAPEREEAMCQLFSRLGQRPQVRRILLRAMSTARRSLSRSGT